MATTTTTLTPATLIAAGTTCAVGTPQRATRYMGGTHGGLLTLKITNGATGPTVPCTCNVLVSHDSGTTPPTAASAGADWKTIFSFQGLTANSGVVEMPFVLPPCRHLEVEFTGNTVQNVTVEAFLTEYTALETA